MQVDLRELETLAASLGDQKLDNYIKRISRKVAKEFYDTLLYNLDNNVYGFVLKPKTIAKKIKAGKPTTPFIFDGYYRAAITLRGSKVFMKKGIHSHAKISYEELMFVLEYGRPDKGLVRRPLWRYTIWDFEARAKEMYLDAITKYFRRNKK